MNNDNQSNQSYSPTELEINDVSFQLPDTVSRDLIIETLIKLNGNVTETVLNILTNDTDILKQQSPKRLYPKDEITQWNNLFKSLDKYNIENIPEELILIGNVVDEETETELIRLMDSKDEKDKKKLYEVMLCMSKEFEPSVNMSLNERRINKITINYKIVILILIIIIIFISIKPPPKIFSSIFAIKIKSSKHHDSEQSVAVVELKR